jgi:hypothetical protein
MTAVANATFFAAEFNTHLRDNLNETAPGKATTAGGIFVATGTNAIAERVPTNAVVAASQSTGSTTYTDLTTPGPAVTVTTGTKAIVMLYTRASVLGVNTTAMGFAVSGASTIAASDGQALAFTSSNGDTLSFHGSAVLMITALAPGSNIFTAKYRVTGGTGTWIDRRLAVIPL